jgi:DNA-binding NtrC family response regulator
VLDTWLLGVRGLDIQIQLTETVIHIPIIFMTGHGDIPMSVRAMKARTVDFWLSHFALGHASPQCGVAARVAHPRTARAVWAMTGGSLKLIIINFISFNIYYI